MKCFDRFFKYDNSFVTGRRRTPASESIMVRLNANYGRRPGEKAIYYSSSHIKKRSIKKIAILSIFNRLERC